MLAKRLISVQAQTLVLEGKDSPTLHIRKLRNNTAYILNSHSSRVFISRLMVNNQLTVNNHMDNLDMAIRAHHCLQPALKATGKMPMALWVAISLQSLHILGRVEWQE